MAYSVLVVFVETAIFTRRVQEHLSDDAYADLQLFLAERPDAGKIIKQSGGIRKLRWGRQRTWQTRRLASDLLLVGHKGQNFDADGLSEERTR